MVCCFICLVRTYRTGKLLQSQFQKYGKAINLTLTATLVFEVEGMRRSGVCVSNL